LEQTRRYGIIAGQTVSPGLIKIDKMVEKPAPEHAPSRMGIAGRYILTPAIFECLRQLPQGVGSEIQLTDGISDLLRQEAVYALQYEGKRFDCGSKLGFLEATVELALLHSEVGSAFRSYLEALPALQR
jgi:UTP--glucose-1-phosphate uridylyltransferase